jgi:hypothetical protein
MRSCSNCGFIFAVAATAITLAAAHSGIQHNQGQVEEQGTGSNDDPNISLFPPLGGMANPSRYPVPIPPGGRFDVHGWLILPLEQKKPISSRQGQGQGQGLKAEAEASEDYELTAWFSHHVPELFIGSPHNFQILFKGTLRPLSCVVGDVYPLSIPYPPEDNLLVCIL